MYKLALVSPLQSREFKWPSMDEIVQLQRAHPDRETMSTRDETLKCFVAPASKIWIPDDAIDLQVRVCVVAHAGAAGHRRIDATTASVEEMFEWRTTKTDVKSFVSACLHCMVVDGESMPQPWGEALHATKPNGLIHFDWVSFPQAANGVKHVLVIKDDMSGFVRLHASSTATSAETAAALMEWFSLFGVVKTWVSDCGSHFKNEVIDAMRRMFGAHHHFVTPHCPWANGTVEVVNRLIVRTLKVLCSEMRIVRTDEPDPKTIDWVKSEMAKHMADLAIALEEMHKEVKATADRKRARARASRTKQRGVKLTKFALSDFVLVARALKHPGKLTLRWKGPCRVVRVLSDHLMEVEQLVPPRETTLHHACRLRLYHEGGHDVDEDLVAQIAFGDEGFYVEGIEDLRMHDGEWQLKIKWMDLVDAESLWEPAFSIYEDVPVLFRRWTTTHQNEDGVSEMVEDVERAIGHPL
ncbi:hypothetical protein Ae201684P_022368 [Aphanomyces euteiches]|uniref:Integrase catalytic domain-containing protein n=1 Tax=Aphanomyces euteiches TaxID=100861 RepID=A0A6G0X6F5_9STRA|nr:hypothetical protein Ae201684_008072 [Aphanomyces euteiches]KAH9074563.1 hypothetical protein Ae201684P_022368 [Aphanomyces euteiches]